MPNPVFALQEERNWLEVIITEHNNFCCGICIAAIEEKLAREGLIRVGGSFHVNSYYSQGLSLPIYPHLEKNMQHTIATLINDLK